MLQVDLASPLLQAIVEVGELQQQQQPQTGEYIKDDEVMVVGERCPAPAYAQQQPAGNRSKQRESESDINDVDWLSSESIAVTLQS